MVGKANKSKVKHASRSSKTKESVRLHHKIKRSLSQIKKRHIRTSIAITGVIFLSVITMLIVYRGHSFEVNWLSIVLVSVILALVLGTIEYLYIVRVKGY